MLIQQLLIKNAYLVIGFEKPQISQSFLLGYIALNIHIDCIDDAVVCHPAFNIIKTLPNILTAAACDDELEPVIVIEIKNQSAGIVDESISV